MTKETGVPDTCPMCHANLDWEAVAVRAENTRLRAALTKICEVVGTSTEAHLVARNALEQLTGEPK